MKNKLEEYLKRQALGLTRLNPIKLSDEAKKTKECLAILDGKLKSKEDQELAKAIFTRYGKEYKEGVLVQQHKY